MIKDRPLNLFPSYQSPALNGVAPGASLSGNAAPPSNGNGSYGPTDASAISHEASEPDGAESGINPLLQGLRSWGAPGPNEEGSANVGQAQNVAGSAPTGQQQPPAQVPVSILRQVLNTEKTAGGMASAGALVSLLSWGLSERQNSGKIRPEFQEILHEAIAFGKEKKLMPEEQLADYESRLFAQDGQGGEGGKGAGKGENGDCSCSKKSSIKDALQRVHAAA